MLQFKGSVQQKAIH